MDLKEDERNFWSLVLLLIKVGKPKIRQFFIDQWNAVKGRGRWTDCEENGKDLLRLYTNPLVHEQDAIKSGNTLKWSLPLVIKVLLHLERQLFIKKSRIKALKYLFELREELGSKREAVIRKDGFKKKWNDACTALTLFGVTSRDFKETKKVMKQDPSFFAGYLALHEEDTLDLLPLFDKYIVRQHSAAVIPKEHLRLKVHDISTTLYSADRPYPIRAPGLMEQPRDYDSSDEETFVGEGSSQHHLDLTSLTPHAADYDPYEEVTTFHPQSAAEGGRSFGTHYAASGDISWSNQAAWESSKHDSVDEEAFVFVPLAAQSRPPPYLPYPIRAQGLTEQPTATVIQQGGGGQSFARAFGDSGDIPVSPAASENSSFRGQSIKWPTLFEDYDSSDEEAFVGEGSSHRPYPELQSKADVERPRVTRGPMREKQEGGGMRFGSAHRHSVSLPHTKIGNKYQFRIATSSFHWRCLNLSEHGIFLEFPPDIPSEPFPHYKTIECSVLSDALPPSPADENEALVSYLVNLKLIHSNFGEVPIFVTLTHSGADKSLGYETVVKAFDEEQRLWHKVEEYEPRTPGYPYGGTNSIRMRVEIPTTVAVVTRLITDKFQVTPEGCVVRSSVCEDVIVDFPEGAVDKTVEGTLKLILMPQNIHHTKDACPILCVDGFSNIAFSKPVIVKMPIPNNAAKYPTNEIRLLRLEDNKWEEDKWEDVTDQTHILKFETHIEFHSTHFSCLWPWMSKTKIKFASTIFRYLHSPPRAVCFAAFKDNEEASLSVRKITLVCVANHKQYETVSNMKGEGCSKLAVATGDRKMRPNDKAYLRINGADMRNESFFLRFLEDEVCRKELSVHDTGQDQESHEELVLNFFPNTEEIFALLLATLRMSKDVVFLGRGRERQKTPMAYPCQLEVEEEAQALEGAVANPLLLSSEEEEEEEDGGIRDLVPHFDQASLATISAEEVAERLPRYLDVDRTSIMDPPHEIMQKCRKFCRLLKDIERKDAVEALRTTLPSGMTGPLLDGNSLVKNLEHSRKLKLSRALSVKEEWRIFAEKIDGLTNVDINFYAAKKDNPVLEILTHYCADMKIDTLYRLLIESGANAIADQCL